MLKLPLKDQRIIQELQKDSRTPVSQIASRVQLSKEVTNYRINRLIEKGIIKRFELIFDYFALGYKIYRILVNLENYTAGDRHRLIDELRAFPLTHVDVFAQGRWDLSIELWVQKPAEYYRLFAVLSEKNLQFVDERELAVISRKIIKGESTLTVLDGSLPATVTARDMMIIEELLKNPRIETTQIARKLKIPVSTVSYRIRQMQKQQFIKHATPILSAHLLGLGKYRLWITLNDMITRTAVVEYLCHDDHVTVINESIGKYDLEIDMLFDSIESADQFLDELRAKISAIKDFDLMVILEK